MLVKMLPVQSNSLRPKKLQNNRHHIRRRLRTGLLRLLEDVAPRICLHVWFHLHHARVVDHQQCGGGRGGHVFNLVHRRPSVVVEGRSCAGEFRGLHVCDVNCLFPGYHALDSDYIALHIVLLYGERCPQRCRRIHWARGKFILRCQDILGSKA